MRTSEIDQYIDNIFLFVAIKLKLGDCISVEGTEHGCDGPIVYTDGTSMAKVCFYTSWPATTRDSCVLSPTTTWPCSSPPGTAFGLLRGQPALHHRRKRGGHTDPKRYRTGHAFIDLGGPITPVQLPFRPLSIQRVANLPEGDRVDTIGVLTMVGEVQRFIGRRNRRKIVRAP